MATARHIQSDNQFQDDEKAVEDLKEIIVQFGRALHTTFHRRDEEKVLPEWRYLAEKVIAFAEKT